jgi:uncharacterized protein YdhG (YjbR/CyaY superfamily)
MKKHYSLYPLNDELVAVFREELVPYDLDQGTIRFPLSEPVPVKLIERVAMFRAKQVAAQNSVNAKRDSQEFEIYFSLGFRHLRFYGAGEGGEACARIRSGM